MSWVLRPMSAGEVLDRAFVLYRSNFVFFSGIGTLPALTCFLAILIFKLSVNIMPSWNGSALNAAMGALLVIGYIALFGIVSFLGVAMATGATVYAVSRLHLGHPVTIRESYRQVGRLTMRILRIVLTAVLRMIGSWVGVYIVVAGAGFGVTALVRARIITPFSLAYRISFICIGAAFFLGGLIWSFRIACKYALAVPACVLEKMPARPALKRSKFLAKGALFRIFLIYLLVLLVGLPIYWVLQIPGMYIAYLDQGTPNLIQVFVGAVVATALAFPIGAIGTSLVYYDQRVKKEAFDLQIMMESLAQPAAHQVAAAAPGIG